MIEVAKPLDTSVLDHLNPNNENSVDVSGYEDVKAPKKSRKEEFLALGYEVIKESNDSDLILVGKKIQ